MIRIVYDEQLQTTTKAVLIRYADHTTWIPFKCCQILDDCVLVPEWLYEKLEWNVDLNDVDFVMDREQAEQIIRENI